jgi:hypothetical protein
MAGSSINSVGQRAAQFASRTGVLYYFPNAAGVFNERQVCAARFANSMLAGVGLLAYA